MWWLSRYSHTPQNLMTWFLSPVPDLCKISSDLHSCTHTCVLMQARVLPVLNKCKIKTIKMNLDFAYESLPHFCQHGDLVYPLSCKWHKFFLLRGWIEFHCVYVNLLICWWAARLVPYLGYYTVYVDVCLCDLCYTCWCVSLWYADLDFFCYIPSCLRNFRI